MVLAGLSIVQVGNLTLEQYKALLIGLNKKENQIMTNHLIATRAAQCEQDVFENLLEKLRS